MLAKPLLFFSSYTPLFAILALRFELTWLIWSCIGLATMGVAALAVLLLAQRSVGAGTHDIEQVEDVGQQASAYLAAYLLPFVTISQPGVRDVLAYALFLAVAAVIHLRSSIVQINPLLYIFGYRVLRVTDSHAATFYLVCRANLVKGDRVRASLWDADVRVRVKDHQSTAGL